MPSELAIKIKRNIEIVKRWILALPYTGKGRWCPVCGKNSRKFREYGKIPRTDALCVHCNSLERHRFAWLYFGEMTNLFDGQDKRVLHVAPEPCFEQRLKRRLGANYITADLLNPHAM